MYQASYAFTQAQDRGESPIMLAFLQSPRGTRVYGKLSPDADWMGNSGSLVLYNGTARIGDKIVFGGVNLLIDWGAYVLSFGSLRETLTADGDRVMIGMQGAEIPSVTLTLDNGSGVFSAMEEMIGQTLTLRLGYPSLGYDDWVTMFTGRVTGKETNVTEWRITATPLTSSALMQPLALRTAAIYANPKSATALLPVVYGDFQRQACRWQPVEIDTLTHTFLLADHPILGIDAVYVDDEAVPEGFTVNLDTADATGARVATLTFDVAPAGEVTVIGQGKASGGVLLENPITILRDLLLTLMPENFNLASLAAAERFAAALGFKAAYALQTNATGAEVIQALLGSFLADWWYNPQQELVVSFALVNGFSGGGVVGFLREAAYDGAQAAPDTIENVCNAVTVAYAFNPATGAAQCTKAVLADAASQSRYGVCAETFEFPWLSNSVAADVLQYRLLDLFRIAPRLLQTRETIFQNCLIERGDLVAASAAMLTDDEGLPLVNQVWRVLEVERNFDDFAIGYLLYDTGAYLGLEPVTYTGMAAVGTYEGRTRNRVTL